MSKTAEVIFGLNFYDPPREAEHHLLKGVNPDPLGNNYTRLEKDEVIDPLENLGVLSKATYDAYGTLDYALGKLDRNTQKSLRKHLVVNGLADTYIHALLPDLCDEDKNILVNAGVERFEGITGKRPRFMWLPEAAIDTRTLETLADYSFEGFLCGPHQIRLDDRVDPSNIPTRIKLPSGRSILAIVYDRELSERLSFDDPPFIDRSDAYRFTDQVALPALYKLKNGFPLLGFTDGETFGRHLVWGGGFADTLVNHALPSRGVNVVSLNNVDMSQVTVAQGKIIERSAWSCRHKDLARWKGAHDCGCGGTDVSWKNEFYHSVHYLRGRVNEIVKRELGGLYLEKIMENFERGYQNSGVDSTPELSLISAKISGLKTVTSCGTFFDNPGFSGNINILFAFESILHLIDAGLVKEARVVKDNFLENMSRMYNPVNCRNGVEMACDLLGKDLVLSDVGFAAAA